MERKGFNGIERKLIYALASRATRRDIAAACSRLSGERRTPEQVRGFMVRRRIMGRSTLTESQVLEVAQAGGVQALVHGDGLQV